MKKANFTKWLLLPVLLLTGVYASAQTLVCNDNVQVSVDPATDGTCTVDLPADMVLEGDPVPGVDYQLDVMQGVNVLFSGINVVSFSAHDYLNGTLTVKAIDLNSGNSCWGTLTIEDKAAPEVICNTVTISCADDFNNVPFPPAFDNCDLNLDVQIFDEYFVDNDICDDGQTVVMRGFIAIDDSGNESNGCYQSIIIERLDVDFPNDIKWSCSQYADYPNITDAAPVHPSVAALEVLGQMTDATGITSASVLANTGSGIPTPDAEACMYGSSYADAVVETCGSTFKIVRTWTVLDWCSGQVVMQNAAGEDNVQIIKIVDEEPPEVYMAPFTVSANVSAAHPQPCKSTGYLPAPQVTDNCHSYTISIFTPVGEADYVNGTDGAQGGFIPAPGLELGFHLILYQAIDECGNVGEWFVEIEVVDDIAPTSICDEITDVNLSSNGEAVVPADVFDDGSHDNCCLDYFEVRRMDGDCNGNYDDFGPDVTFCCSDAGTSVVVVFRAYDCFGNYNDCMVSVEVQDKIPPVNTFCPDDVTITCDDYLENLAAALEPGDGSVLDQYGEAAFYDNCDPIVTYEWSYNINTCTEGTITRTWTATDASDNTQASCTQTIYVQHVSDWVVEFPANITAQCVDGQLPDFGEPVITHDECELIGVSYQDEQFDVVPDACYKIIRHWSVINWCVFDQYGSDVYSEAGHYEAAYYQDWDGDGDQDTRTFREGYNDAGIADGYITYDQVIKVVDNEAPIFDVEDQTYCIEETDCDTDITLPEPDVTDCSAGIEITVSSEDLAAYASADQYSYGNVPPGEYVVNYEVTDNCGNVSYDEIVVTVVDCKKPTPYCVEGLVIEIMQTGMIDIWASDFDAGSFDNCPGELKLSFSPDVTDIERVYTCDQLGQQPIELWVTDAAGNQDFCATYVEVQDNMNACPAQAYPVIAGVIATENEQTVEGVMVDVNNGLMTMLTPADGSYHFDMEPGGDYTVTPTLDSNPLNGVTTLDMVIIMRHILGVELLETPYQMIAADANNSESISTLDLVIIQKLILLLESDFPANTSWRFVDKDYVFPNPSNPWAESFPEVINYNNFTQDDLFADFVAVKIGDVNGSVQANATDNAVEFNTTAGEMVIELADESLQAGEHYTLDFTAADAEVSGYQFALRFDTDKLELEEVVPALGTADNFGLTQVDEGLILTNWAEAKSRNLAGQVLFSLRFKALASAKWSEALSLDRTALKPEAYNQADELLDVQLSIGGAIAQDGIALYQNEPNPFRDETVIGFYLPPLGEGQADESVTLSIMDTQGRILRTFKLEYKAGYQQVELSDLSAQGVLYYRLETAGHTLLRKMLRF